MQNDKATDINKSRNLYMAGLPKWQAGDFIMELVTTFKKNNKSGQTIFEYIILTCLTMAILFGFSQTTFFQNVRGYLNDAFDEAVIKILEVPSYT